MFCVKLVTLQRERRRGTAHDGEVARLRYRFDALSKYSFIGTSKFYSRGSQRAEI